MLKGVRVLVSTASLTISDDFLQCHGHSDQIVLYSGCTGVCAWVQLLRHAFLHNKRHQQFTHLAGCSGVQLLLFPTAISMQAVAK